MQAKDMGELLKWAQRASRLEYAAKLRVARLIVKSRRMRCEVLGCTNRDNPAPCSRCGAR